MHGHDHDRRRGRPDGVPGRGGASKAPPVPGKATLVGATAGLALPPALRARLERALSTDLSAVRVGVDPRVADMGARAVASGATILFAPGAYQPRSREGEALIAHEVVHLTQQADNRVAPGQVVGELAINHDTGLESEADELGARALRGEVVRSGGAAPSASAAPYQGFFENLGKLGDLIHTVFGGDDDQPEVPALAEDMAGSFALQRILESESVSLVGAAHDALLAAQRARAETQVLDVVFFDGDGCEYSLDVAATVTDAMIPAMRTRRDELSHLDVDPAWVAFAARFNKHFASVLHAFDLDEVRDDTRKPEVIAARYQYLFTVTQRELLTGYISDRMIPDRLFDGDETGRLTAQQRILIASKILADGNYRPGSFVQDVHAKFCYHWARIVYQYAGVADRTWNTGIEGSFDLMGGVLLGQGMINTVFGREQDPSLDPSAEHLARFPGAVRDANAPWSAVRDLQPGDWIYIYTENRTKNGAHSVIFNGWEGPEGFDPDAKLHYRAASMFDQTDYKVGGGMHTRILGEDFFAPKSGGTARPVSLIMRADPDAAPADTVAELTGKVTEDNKAFERWLGKKYGTDKRLDKVKLVAWLREANAGYIETLEATEGRLTDGQARLFREANAGTDKDVYALYQRLYALVKNSKKLDDQTDATYTDALEDRKADADAAYLAAAGVLHYEIAMREIELFSIEMDADQLRDQIAELEEAATIKDLYAERKRCARELKHLAGKAVRRAKLDEIHAIDDRIDDAKREARSHKPEIRQLEKDLAPLKKRERALEHEIARRERQLAKLVPPKVYGLVAPGDWKHGTQLIRDGGLGHLPGVPWETFMVPNGP
jgi:hypothetical protein